MCSTYIVLPCIVLSSMQGNTMKVGAQRCKLVSGQKSRQLSNWASNSVAAYNFFEKRVDF